MSEAEVRAACARKNITDEAEIRKKIEAKAAMRVLDREEEIKPILRGKLLEFGKFAAYEALVGAKRPVTRIEKGGNGKWIVTTLVDKNGAPLLKPVSAFDIDRNFSKLVDMYLEDAVEMGMVEHKTVAAEPVFATREDLRAEGVLGKAALFRDGKADFAQLAGLVKAEFSYDPGSPDGEFQAKTKAALDEILTAKKDNPADTQEYFKRFVDNYADASYFDRMSDVERLIHLLARRAELLVDREKAFQAKIPEASVRCAMMMKKAFQKANMHVYVAKTASYIEMTLKQMVRQAFHGKEGVSLVQQTKTALNNLMLNGILITDHPKYDLAHRAAGRDEVKLFNQFQILMRCMKRYANAPQNYYMRQIKG